MRQQTTPIDLPKKSSKSSIRDKLIYYYQFLELHKEAKKNRVIVRDRKMLGDEDAGDPRKGYAATINRLFRSCISSLFDNNKFKIVKDRNFEHVYDISSDNINGDKDISKIYAALILQEICNKFGNDTVAEEMIQENRRIQTEGNVKISTDYDPTVKHDSSFIWIDGVTTNNTDLVRTYQKTRELKKKLIKLRQDFDSRETKDLGSCIRDIISGINSSPSCHQPIIRIGEQAPLSKVITSPVDTKPLFPRTHEELLERAVRVAGFPHTQLLHGEFVVPTTDISLADVEEKRAALFNNIPENERPNLASQQRYARLLLERERRGTRGTGTTNTW